MIQLEPGEYEDLVALADATAQTSAETARALQRLIAAVNRRNNLVFSAMWVNWEEADQPLPFWANFPTSWPPLQRSRVLVWGRTVGKRDVDAILAHHAKSPKNIMLTTDPAATVGWTSYAAHFGEPWVKS